MQYGDHRKEVNLMLTIFLHAQFREQKKSDRISEETVTRLDIAFLEKERRRIKEKGQC